MWNKIIMKFLTISFSNLIHKVENHGSKLCKMAALSYLCGTSSEMLVTHLTLNTESLWALFYWPLINFLTKALCGRKLIFMWKSLRVSRKAARTKPLQTEHNTIRPTTMENVMNHMEQQNMELTFTQMPQPMHSSSEMKAIFACEETSIQSLPATHTHTHTHTHTCSAAVQSIRYPDATVFAKTILSRTERRWELRQRTKRAASSKSGGRASTDLSSQRDSSSYTPDDISWACICRSSQLQSSSTVPTSRRPCPLLHQPLATS
jgi:hypothetical protein